MNYICVYILELYTNYVFVSSIKHIIDLLFILLVNKLCIFVIILNTKIGAIMDNKEFESLLKNTGLSKKEFAVEVGMNYNSVTNWNKSDKVPEWVKSWIENYIKAKNFDNAKKIFCEDLK